MVPPACVSVEPARLPTLNGKAQRRFRLGRGLFALRLRATNLRMPAMSMNSSQRMTHATKSSAAHSLRAKCRLSLASRNNLYLRDKLGRNRTARKALVRPR